MIQRMVVLLDLAVAKLPVEDETTVFYLLLSAMYLCLKLDSRVNFLTFEEFLRKCGK